VQAVGGLIVPTLGQERSDRIAKFSIGRAEASLRRVATFPGELAASRPLRGLGEKIRRLWIVRLRGPLAVRRGQAQPRNRPRSSAAHRAASVAELEDMAHELHLVRIREELESCCVFPRHYRLVRVGVPFRHSITHQKTPEPQAASNSSSVGRRKPCSGGVDRRDRKRRRCWSQPRCLRRGRRASRSARELSRFRRTPSAADAAGTGAGASLLRASIREPERRYRAGGHRRASPGRSCRRRHGGNRVAIGSRGLFCSRLAASTRVSGRVAIAACTKSAQDRAKGWDARALLESCAS